MPPTPDRHALSARVTGAILAGGRATRMGGQDKGLVELSGRCMVDYVLSALRPQVHALVINANRSRARYAAYGYPVIGDEMADYQGPLAGIAATMAVAKTPLLLSLPCDGPLVPPDLAARLGDALAQAAAEIAVAHDGQRTQPVFALLRIGLLPSLRAYLDAGERKIDRWYAQHRVVEADFSDVPETFINVNTPQQRDELAERLARQA